MIDLTPLDVRKKRGDFRRILRGYDPEEVDTFMDLVAERFEELVRENLVLSERTGRIESQLEALEGREKAVQEALVMAQKLREDVRDQTHRDAEVLHAQTSREAELLKAEAGAEIARRLGEAEGLILERQRAIEDLERSRLKFLKSFRGLLERELDSVEVEESRRPLEETPLELEFRGWMPESVSEEETGEAEADEEEAAESESEAEEGEAEVEEGMPDGFETQLLEGAAPAGLSFFPEEELGLGAEIESEADLEGELGAEIESEADLEGERGAEIESEAALELELGAEAEAELEASSSSKEPKWLFSLLKREQDGTGGEG